jgi:hypothetical protein
MKYYLATVAQLIVKKYKNRLYGILYCGMKQCATIVVARYYLVNAVLSKSCMLIRYGIGSELEADRNGGGRSTMFRIDDRKETVMRNIRERLERLFAAVSFAEAGDHATARKLMEQRTRGADVFRITVERGTAASHVRPKRRAA